MITSSRRRISIIRAICVTLFLSLFVTFPTSTANAVTSVTKTVTIKGSNDALYNGAAVGVVYFVDGTPEEIFQPLQTSGSNGQVTISYPSNASYAQMFITPPEADTTNAVQTIDLLTSTDAVITNVKLKTSNIRIKTQTPASVDSGLHTCVDYPKVASSRWVTTQYRTTRTGAFGLAIPSVLNPLRDYQITVSPCAKTDYNYLAKAYGLRRASNGTLTLYTDDTFKTAATAVSNVYTLKFGQGKVRGQILDASGNSFTVSSGTYSYLHAVPINSDGTFDTSRNYVGAYQTTPDNKFAFEENFEPGRYRIYVRSYGTNPFASFIAGEIWVDSTLRYSTTESGTYSTTLDLSYRLPSTGVLKFALVGGSGVVDQVGGFVRITTSGATGKLPAFTLSTNEQGFASGQVPDGTYTLTASPKSSVGLDKTYSMIVNAGVVTLKDSNNQVVTKSGDYYPLITGTPNVKFKMVSPSDSLTSLTQIEAFLYDSDYSNEIGYFWSETATSFSQMKLAPGSYHLDLNPYSQQEPLASSKFTIDVDSSSVVVKRGTTVITPTNGIYVLSAKRPTFVGQVLNPAGTEAVRWAEVRAISASNPKLSFYASTNSAGDYSMDLGDPITDGIYYVYATPQVGVNANYGTSESVTVRVTSGLPDLAVVTIRLRTANVSGTVSGPNGPSPQNWLTVQESRTGTYLDPTIEGPLTDEDGGYSLYLPNGAYGITPSSDYANTGGVANGPKVCVAGTNPVTCNINLVAPNVSGSITLGGEKPMQSMVGFAPLASDPLASKIFSAKYGGTLWSGWSDINNYGLKVDSGTYRMWIAYQTYTNEQSTVPGPICIVPETGTVVCDATLPAANLKIQVADWNGNAIRGNVSAAIQYKDGSNYFWTCCANSDPSLLDGKIQVGLINGSYKLLLNSTDNIGDGVQQTYYFDVSGGNVNNLRLTESGTAISASAGLYTLRLKEPVISGVLYGVNGTTPKPYAEVRLYNASGEEINNSRTDRLGRFAFEFEDVLANGTYFASGFVRQSLTEGNSKFESFTVVNGKATSTVTLRLNTPNVTGIASGPLGVSPYTFVQAQTITSTSIFAKNFYYTFTDGDGKFAFYLPTGTYTFYGDTQFEKTGGIAGNSSPCTVNGESTTATTCNIEFATPNVTGTITNAGAAATNGYVLFFPAYGIAGNTATNSYGWIYASSGKYGISAGPGTYRSYTLSYPSKVKGQVITPGPLCVVPSTGSVICNITRGSPNLNFVVKNFSGAALTADYSYLIEVKNGNQWQSAGDTTGFSAATASQFLFDGSYRIKISPVGLGLTDGSIARYTFEVTGGVVANLQSSETTTVITPTNGIYILQTSRPNVQGNVTGPRGNAANVWVEVLQSTSDGKGFENTSFSVITDNNGKFALRLPVGVYLLKARPDYATTGAADTTVRCEVISETATAVTCNIALALPNVSGSVKVAGTNVPYGSIMLSPANGVAGNKTSSSSSWADLNSGNYGITVTPGTYRALLSIPVGTDWEIIPAGLCVVPETGTVTCNYNLPNVNFVVSVLSTSGAELSSAGIEIATLNGESADSICCNDLNRNTKRKAFALLDGKYRVRVFPWGSGGSQIYLLTIETGTVTSLKAFGSNLEVLAVNGSYPLRLKPPTFSGVVYKPGGTTPAANTYVLAMTERQGWGTFTDIDGKFSFDIDPTITDATFTFTAQPNRLTYQVGTNLDKTLGSSAPKQESVTAGVGSQNVSITLRTATVTGRITGYKGALINHDVTFQKLDGAGNWNWTGINAYTDKNGEYSEYLASGTYRLFSWGDTKGAGGGESYGNPCLVNAESTTASTCNLVLVAPNTIGTAKYNGVNIEWGQVEFQPDWSIKTNTPRRSYWSSVDQGSFGATMQADTYQLSIWFSLNGKYNRVFGPKCVVPETGTVTCDINLPGINLSYKVLDSNNNLITSNVYSSLEIKSGDSWNWSCCSYPDSNLRDGRFDVSLVDGSYRLGVRPDNASVSGSTQNYTFIVESGTVKNFAKEGSSETLTATNGVFTTKLRPAALTGTVYKTDGTTPYVNARVCAKPSSQNGQWWQMCTGTNNAGKFTFDQNGVTDDTWTIQAFSTNNDLTQGSSIRDSVTVTASLGSKVLSLSLRAPNVTGTVTGPLRASPNNFINVRRYFDNGGYDYVDLSFVTDSQGRFAFTLEPGRYRFQAENDMAVAGGTSALSSECIITGSTPITCDIALQAPNVTGTVTIAGQVVSASVEFVRESSNGFESLGNSSGTNQLGGYWMTVTPGTYRTRIYLYSSSTWMVGPRCVVQVGINATCNINLPGTNFQFKVNKASGTLATSGIYVDYNFKSGDRQMWGGNSFMDKNGLFKNSLVDGTYILWLQPNGSDATIGTRASYTVVVDSGTVSSVIREGSNTALTATDGVYTLLLGVPSISGTVVAQDGTTPVPNTRVAAFIDPYSYNETWADQNAAYGFAKLPDGTYSVIASPGFGDATKAPSLPTKITVTNGVGASDVKLTLRTPNVTGVVRGATGKVSQYNWLEVEQKMNGGWWKRPDYFMGNTTSAEGSYGFYLEPGVYRIRAQGDMRGAGGVATVVICTVPSTGTVTCNITLKSPNFKIRVVAPGSTTYNMGSWAWTYLQSTTNEDAITNRNPYFEWDQNGNYQTVLEDGTWVVRTEGGENPLYSNTQFTVVVSGGVVTQVSNEKNETLTAVAGTYLLPLIGSNLTGTISFNGVQFQGGASVQVLRQEGDYWYYYTSKWSSSGTFGFMLPAGNYKVEVVPYWNNQNISVAATKSDLCVVEATGTTICNVLLKEPNLHGKITDKLGAVFRYSDAYMLIQQQNKGEQWLRWLNLTDGLFDTYLEDGIYRLQVMPRWEFRATYTDRSYIIKVETGTITSVTDAATGSLVTASNGLYSFTLGTPSVTGRVFNPGLTTGAANVNIVVAPSQSPGYWKYSAQSDSNGNFALTVPNGTYVVQAIPTNGGFQFGKSETKTITITGGVLSGIDSVTLVLRTPNLTGRIVTPGLNPQPLANVNVNIYVDGEYFYGWTDSDGRFGAYVDNRSPQCPSRCSINLNYFKSSLYTPKYYTISTVGDLGDFAIGGVTTKLTVKVPQTTGDPLASRYSWVSVERVFNDGSRAWVTSGSTDENGTVGLSLDTGNKYWIWAYPNGEQSNGFAPKKLEILNYSPDTHAVLAMVFDLPNVKLRVQGADGTSNTYGWYSVSAWDSATSTATKYSNASLDSKGLSALTLVDGDYQLRFWPGQGARGVQKVITFHVSGSTITWISGNIAGADSISGNLVTVKLPSGNISGTILSAGGLAVASALVAAYRADDLSKFVTTSSDANGNYQLNLDLTYSWIVKSVDPVSNYSGSTNIAARSPSNDVLASQNVTLSTAP